MCGHVGVVGPTTILEERIFNQMLVMDSVRGTDSTGIAVVPRTGEVKVAKELGDPYLLFDTKRHVKAMSGSQRCIIGHNRYATMGNVSNKNAHPFEFETLVGAHNGTLTSKWRLEDATDFTVDSENLFHHINKKGLKDALTKMSGAWALVWWDKEHSTLNFLRNKERTLYWAMTEDKKFMYWASEMWMIQAALGRNGVKCDTPEMFKEDIHYSIPVDNAGVMGKVTARHAPSTYTYPVYVPQQNVKQQAPWAVPHKPVNNVVVLPKLPEVKKQGVVPSLTNPQPSRSGYAYSKGVRMELLECCSDRHGASYYACFDDSMPAAKIRLYYNTHNIKKPNIRLGEEIIADIGEMRADGAEGMYYKVVASSVAWEEEDEGDPVGPSQELEDDTVNDAVYPGHTSKMLNMTDWVSQYGDCVWCSTPILPTDRHALTTEGQCLCHDCVSDAQISEYVQIAGGIRN